MNEIGDQVMFDNDALNFLQKNQSYLIEFSESDIDLYVSVFQYNEFTGGLDNLPEDRKTKVIDQIHKLEIELEPEKTGIETSGYGEAYGYNYGGSTGEIYKELIETPSHIGEVDRPDAVGAEAAINRDMPFVTGDGALQDSMRHHGYDEYLIELEELRQFLEEG